MNRRLLATIVAVWAVAACADEREQSPTSPDLAPRTTTCNYTDVKKYARDLFGSNSAGYDLAQQMSGFAAQSDEATELGFDIFAAIAAAAPFTGTAVDNAANLTVQVIGCSNVSASGSTTVAAFTAALGPTGGYEVRGDATKDAALDNVPVTTADGLSGVNAPNGESFSSWLDVRTLFYGRPITTFSSEQSGGRAYDWSILQPGATLTGISSPALVTVCVEVDNSVDLTDLRVQHAVGTLQTILPLTPPFLICPDPVTVGAASSSMTQRLIRFFAPTPAYAAMLAKSGSPTGSAGSFSPFEGINPVSVNAAFVSQPKDGRKDQPLTGTSGPISVKVTGAAFTPWQAVTVKMTAVNNNGETVALSNDVAVTDERGIASFPLLSTNKTGAYKLVATTQESSPGSSSFLQTSVTSRKFNVRP